MKIPNGLIPDEKYHQFCISCLEETIEWVKKEGLSSYKCLSCGKEEPRSLVIDPAIEWWLDEKQEYWHESSGVFVRNPKGEYLVFKRKIFPFTHTVPSGHVDKGETPLQSAIRELKEEVGIEVDDLKHIATENIVGDSCRRGADCHKWSAFLLELPKEKEVEIHDKDEGDLPMWINVLQLRQLDLTYPVRYIIERHEQYFY